MSNEDVAEFARGQRDCREGVTHVSQGDSYNRGYAFEYELQECKSNNGSK